MVTHFTVKPIKNVLNCNGACLPPISEVKWHTLHLSKLREAFSQFIVSHGPADAADVHHPALVLCERIKCDIVTAHWKSKKKYQYVSWVLLTMAFSFWILISCSLLSFLDSLLLLHGWRKWRVRFCSHWMCQLSHKIRGNDKSVRLFLMSKVRTSSLWKLATTALYLNWMVTAHQQYSLTCKSLSTAYSIFVEMATETGMWTGTKI